MPDARLIIPRWPASIRVYPAQGRKAVYWVVTQHRKVVGTF